MRRIPIYTQDEAGEIEVPDLTSKERWAHFWRKLNTVIGRACNWRVALAIVVLALLAPVVARGLHS